MDKISYTWGGMAELNQKYWAFRAGYFLVPAVSNADDFDMQIPSRRVYRLNWNCAIRCCRSLANCD